MTDVPALCFSPVFPCLVLVALSTLQTPAVLPRSEKRLVSPGAGHGAERPPIGLFQINRNCIAWEGNAARIYKLKKYSCKKG